MITLLIAQVTNSQIIEVLGYISAALESLAAISIVIAKVITIVKAKDLNTKEKLKELDKTSKDLKK